MMAEKCAETYVSDELYHNKPIADRNIFFIRKLKSYVDLAYYNTHVGCSWGRMFSLLNPNNLTIISLIISSVIHNIK